MGRSRSRSPTGSKRDRRRSRSRERRHRKRRSRSRSPRRRHRSPSNEQRKRSRSPRINISDSPERTTEQNPILIPDTDDVVIQEGGDEQVDMMKLMGFSTFDSTKGKKVEGTDVSAVNLQKKRRYRQYMNRKGGFNRPLDFIA